MKINTFSNNIKLGFFIIASIFTSSIFYVAHKIHHVDEISKRISEVRAPTIQSGNSLLTALNQSLAALRGWMLLKNDNFKIERKKSWNTIHSNIDALSKLSISWTNHEDMKIFNEIKKQFLELESYQDRIEKLVGSTKNMPAIELYDQTINHSAKSIFSDITTIIDSIKKDKTNSLFFSLSTDFRGFSSKAISYLKVYIYNHNPQDLKKFNTHLDKATTYLKQMNTHKLASASEISNNIKNINRNMEMISSGSKKIVNILSSKKWNVADYELEYKAVPVARKIREHLEAMVSDQKKLITSDTKTTSQSISNLSLLQWILLAVAITGCFIISGIITRLVTNPINQVIAVAKKVANGDYQFDINLKGPKEIGMMNDALKTMVSNLKRITEVAENISQGNYDDHVVVKNDKDILSSAINTMTANLKQITEENNKGNWLKTCQAELSNRIRGKIEVNNICQIVIDYLTEYMNAQVSTCYIMSEEGVLELVCSYAFDERKWTSSTFKPGQSIIGQSSLEKKPMLITPIPDDYIKINSGLGESSPKSILVFPCITDDKVKCVIEIGSIESFNENVLELIGLIQENIAIAIASSQDRQKMQSLLEETQAQSAELQQQQEELKASNEELEQKTQTLKQSQEELIQQSEELQASNEELEEKTQCLELQRTDIEEKNKALQEKQEEISEKARALEVSSKYKSEFLANMSHELRTPLNSLLILSDLLLENNEGNLTEEQLKSIGVISNGGKDLLRLIGDILDLSKVEAGKLHAHIENVSLEQLIQTLSNQFEPVAQKRQVKFIIEQELKEQKNLQTDGQRLEQIIKNLLSNAFKFTKEGSVKLKFYKPDNSSNFNNENLSSSNVVAISVIDTGIGIPENQLAAVFEAFQQVDGSISRKYAGTGLGLAISTQLAELLGGEVQVESVEGQGSTFTLYIPLKHSEFKVPDMVSTNSDNIVLFTENDDSISEKKSYSADPKENQEALASNEKSKEVAKNSEKNTLLIIEDDISFSELIKDIATQKGFNCTVVHHGGDGLKEAIKKRPSAIILDLVLPDVDGMSVLQQLKQNPETRHIPVHISSCQDEKTLTMKLGAIGNLLKPATKDDLESALRDIEKVLQNTVKDVLIIEDDKGSQDALTQLISNKNVSIQSIGTGEEALKLISNHRFDCIILDLKLPDMTGLDLLKTINNNIERYNYSPVVVYTGKDLSQEEHHEIQQYASSIVLKVSNSPERLVNEVSLFLHSMNSQLPEMQRNSIKKLNKNDEALKGKKILLVDDDMRNIYALSTALRGYGLNVTMAGSGLSALNKLEESNDYDLILMDIMMPEIDGYEAIEKIRANDHTKNIPIIAVTAKAMVGDERKCIEAGANDYLTKPIDIALLVPMMRIWISQNV